MTVELARCTWETAGDALHSRRVGLLPVGSIENHGLHLPLGTDLFTAEHIARTVAARMDLILLPSVPVSLASEHRHFTGTLWVQRDTLCRYVAEILRASAAHGLRRFILVNGHGGNADALLEVCRSLREEQVYAYMYQWWTAIHATVAEICTQAPDHAGDMETSVMMALAPQDVRTERIGCSELQGASRWGRSVHGVTVAFDTAEFSLSGSTGRPTAATTHKGQRLLEAAAASLEAFASWLVEQDDAQLAPQAPVSASDTRCAGGAS